MPGISSATHAHSAAQARRGLICPGSAGIWVYRAPDWRAAAGKINSIVLPVLLVLLTMLPAQAADLVGNKAVMVQSLLPTVVNIATSKALSDAPANGGPAMVGSDQSSPQSPPGQPVIKNYVGSGFIVDGSGLIVTNYHVVEDAFQIIITLSDGTRIPGRMLSASRLADLAVVKIETNHKLTTAQWGDSDRLQVGDQVFAIGNPFGLGMSVSSGIVSALNRDIQNSPYDDLIQTDATINHGNSGGPLFDMDGKVVGVNSAIISPTTGSAGLGFAIPSRSAHFVVDRLLKYGWVRPAWIGVKVQQVTPDMATALGMADLEGSIVAWVRQGGPSDKAGLAVGDVIVRFNGTRPSDERALLRSIAETDVGDTIRLTVLRDGKTLDIPIVTDAWPRNQWDALDAPKPAETPKITIPPDLGLTLAPLPPEERAKLDLNSLTEGVLVQDVAPNTPAAGQGIKSGDAILRVQDDPVTTPEQVLNDLKQARDSKRYYVLVLVWPKVRPVPGPRWVALAVRPEVL